MTRDEIKREVFRAIERRAEEIIALGETIRRHPELGFKEVKTARLVEETLGRLGLAPKSGLALTGVRADLAGRGGDGPTFAVLGELDALVVAGHPEADAQSGAAHACGHNAQVAGMLGAAMGLVDAKASEHLPGAWSSSRSRPRSTGTSSGAWDRPARARWNFSEASLNYCAWATSTTSTWP